MMMRAILQGIEAMEKTPRMILMQTRKIVAFQIHDKMGVKHFKVILNKEADSRNTIQFNQSEAGDRI
jgi:hypothetical protein